MGTKIMRIVIVLTFISLTSCETKTYTNNLNPDTTIENQQNLESYYAVLRPMNNSLSGFIPSGMANFKFASLKLSITTYLDDDAKVVHIQKIYEGPRCPTLADDTNQDGIIDVEESILVTGAPILSLDSDLSSDENDKGIYPMGGGFTYKEQINLSNLTEDLITSANLLQRVVMIHGVAHDTKMPSTTMTQYNLPPQASVPIACGVIQR